MVMSLSILFFSIVFIILINFFFRYKNFLVDLKILKHKTYISKNSVPLSGGFLIFCYLLLFTDIIFLKLIFFFVFILGVLSDLFVISNPLKKMILQIFITLLFVIFSGIYIHSTKIIFIDYFLQYRFFAIFFTCLCLLILINGSNFMDGINTLVIGYYILVILSILYLGFYNEINYNFNNYYNLLLVLLILFFFNALSKIYLGDSGVFLLSFAIGYYLIDFSNNNLDVYKFVSPIFIMLLLWYPAFENLFSILRKKYNKVSPYEPDNKHLHHLLFSFLNKKTKKNVIFLNTLTGIIINFYNFLVFYFSLSFYENSKFLSYMIILNVFTYLSFYFFLYKRSAYRNYR
jgi:UDP-N-acetylmuramyl pentapeptide phosphotransferase/UDP-N-acetylglucosamine-1-phosphate transferase